MSFLMQTIVVQSLNIYDIKKNTGPCQTINFLLWNHVPPLDEKEGWRRRERRMMKKGIWKTVLHLRKRRRRWKVAYSNKRRERSERREKKRVEKECWVESEEEGEGNIQNDFVQSGDEVSDVSEPKIT